LCLTFKSILDPKVFRASLTEEVLKVLTLELEGHIDTIENYFLYDHAEIRMNDDDTYDITVYLNKASAELLQLMAMQKDIQSIFAATDFLLQQV
jgi:hypothetical protein